MKLAIGHRIILSFLFVTTASLAFLGAYLLDYFYQQNLASKSAHLVTNARIIEKTLEKSLYDPLEKRVANEEVKKISDATGLRITIIDADGTVIIDSWEKAEILDNHMDRDEVHEAFNSTYATAIRYSSTISQNMLYAAIPVYSHGAVISIVRTATTLAPVEKTYQDTRAFIFKALIATILLAITVGTFLAHHQTKPIKQMTIVAQKITSGELKRRIHIHTNDELEVLAHAINQLTSTLEDKIAEIDTEAKKLSLILENMDNAVILFDTYGNVTTANNSAKETFHITDDLLGKHSISVIGNSVLTQTAQDVLAEKNSRSININLRVNNAKKTFQVFFAPIAGQSPSLTGVLTVFHDISILQEIYDRQVEFVSNASHELKTPLTAIKGFAETLLDGALENPVLCRKFVTVILTESERMGRLIHDLLQLAKLDNQDYQSQVSSEQIYIHEIFTSVQQKLAPQLNTKNHTLDLPISAKSIAVHANYDWLMQLVVNLTENAIKYTPENGTITYSITVEGDFAYISVADNGIGIASEDLPFVFERFYRADKARARSDGGSGIGLSLARFIVEMLGGKITVESKQNIGTKFTFSLPLHK